MKWLRPGAFGELQTQRFWLEIHKGCSRRLLIESEISDACGEMLLEFVVAIGEFEVAYYWEFEKEWKFEEMRRV